MNKGLTIFLLVTIGILSTGCAVRTVKQPVVSNNKYDEAAYFGYNYRYIIDVIKNTPAAEKIFPKEFKKAIEKEFLDYQSTPIKYKETSVNVDLCRYPKGHTPINIMANNRMRETCRKIHNYDYIKVEKRKVYQSGTNLQYKDITKIEQSKNDSILYSFQIKIKNSSNENYTYYVEKRDDGIVIYKTSNKTYPYEYITNIIEKIINNNKDLNSLKLQYYNY